MEPEQVVPNQTPTPDKQRGNPFLAIIAFLLLCVIIGLAVWFVFQVNNLSSGSKSDSKNEVNTLNFTPLPTKSALPTPTPFVFPTPTVTSSPTTSPSTSPIPTSKVLPTTSPAL